MFNIDFTKNPRGILIESYDHLLVDDLKKIQCIPNMTCLICGPVCADSMWSISNATQNYSPYRSLTSACQGISLCKRLTLGACLDVSNRFADLTRVKIITNLNGVRYKHLAQTKDR